MPDASRFLRTAVVERVDEARVLLGDEQVSNRPVLLNGVFKDIDIDVLGKEGAIRTVYKRLVDGGVPYADIVLTMPILEARIEQYFEIMKIKNDVRAKLEMQLADLDTELTEAEIPADKHSCRGEISLLKRKLGILESGDPVDVEALVEKVLGFCPSAKHGFTDFDRAFLYDRLSMATPGTEAFVVERVSRIVGAEALDIEQARRSLRLGTAEVLWVVMAEDSDTIQTFLERELYVLFDDARLAETARKFQPKDLRKRGSASLYNEQIGWLYAVIKPLPKEKRPLAMKILARAMSHGVVDLEQKWKEVEGVKKSGLSQRLNELISRIDNAWEKNGPGVKDLKMEDFLETGVYSLIKDSAAVEIARKFQPEDFVLRRGYFFHEQAGWIYFLLKLLPEKRMTVAIRNIAKLMSCDEADIRALWIKVSRTKKRNLPERLARELYVVDRALCGLKREEVVDESGEKLGMEAPETVADAPVNLVAEELGTESAGGDVKGAKFAEVESIVPVLAESKSAELKSAELKSAELKKTVTFGPDFRLEGKECLKDLDVIDGTITANCFDEQKKAFSRMSLAEPASLRLRFKGFKGAEVADFLLGELRRYNDPSHSPDLSRRWADLLFDCNRELSPANVPAKFVFGMAFRGPGMERFIVPEIPLSSVNDDVVVFKRMRLLLSFFLNEAQRALHDFFAVKGTKAVETHSRQLDALYNFCLEAFFGASRPEKIKVVEKKPDEIAVVADVSRRNFQDQQATVVLKFCLDVAMDLFECATVKTKPAGLIPDMFFVDSDKTRLDGEWRLDGLRRDDKFVYYRRGSFGNPAKRRQLFMSDLDGVIIKSDLDLEKCAKALTL